MIFIQCRIKECYCFILFSKVRHETFILLWILSSSLLETKVINFCQQYWVSEQYTSFWPVYKLNIPKWKNLTSMLKKVSRLIVKGDLISKESISCFPRLKERILWLAFVLKWCSICKYTVIREDVLFVLSAL